MVHSFDRNCLFLDLPLKIFTAKPTSLCHTRGVESEIKLLVHEKGEKFDELPNISLS